MDIIFMEIICFPRYKSGERLKHLVFIIFYM